LSSFSNTKNSFKDIFYGDNLKFKHPLESVLISCKHIQHPKYPLKSTYHISPSTLTHKRNSLVNKIFIRNTSGTDGRV